MNLKVSLALAGLTLLAAAQAHAQFTYTFYPNNAVINNTVNTDFAIVGFAGGSYDENDFSRHFTGPSSPTVQIAAGADVSSEIDILNNSVVHVSGGNVAAIVPGDNSVVTISGGSSSFVLGVDHSIINVTGGFVDDLEGQGKQINVSGGTVGGLIANGSTDYLGNSQGSSIANVTGGEITGQTNAYNAGILNLYGGQFDGDLFARFGGTINIFGSGLSTTLLNPNYQKTYSLYSLTGRLGDGSVLANKNLFIENDGVTYGHSSFRLFNAVPEPGPFALLASGLCGSALLALRRKWARKTR